MKKAIFILLFFLIGSYTRSQNVAWQPETIIALTSGWTGERLPDGSFEPDTINHRVDQHLRNMAEALLRFGKEDGHKQEQNEPNNHTG